MSEEYIKYQHVEKIGTDEVDGILFGECYIFPKIDGTNSHIWWDGEQMHYGSRKRELSLDNDNAGFMAWAIQQQNLTDLAKKFEGCHIFGEWLVPHSLKTYREDAWQRFYIFDICRKDENGQFRQHIPYPDYENTLNKFGVDYIPPLRIIKNPQLENIERCLSDNTFMIKDGEGCGEGVVIKNYSFVNKYGRQTWAKLTTSEFKEKHLKEMGAPVSLGTSYIEEEIVTGFLTAETIEKAYANIVSECNGWSSKYIPRLLSSVWHDFIIDFTWEFLKKHKNPKIDFKVLNRFVINRIKEQKPELF